MYKNHLCSDEKGEVDMGFVVPSEQVLVGQLPSYALTKAANSAGTKGEHTFGILLCSGLGCCAREGMDPPTISSNLAIAVAVTGCQESLGLSVGQSASTSREVLQEQPAGKQRWSISPADTASLPERTDRCKFYWRNHQSPSLSLFLVHLCF